MFQFDEFICDYNHYIIEIILKFVLTAHKYQRVYNVRDHASQPYRKTDNIFYVYILIFKFLEKSLEYKRVWTE